MNEWRQIRDYPDYYVSRAGQVKSIIKNYERLLTLTPHGFNGYIHVKIRNAQHTKTIPVHRLVALSFIPNPENKPMVDHGPGGRHDNRVENLQWVTNQENILLRFARGPKRANKGNSKLTETQRAQVCALYKTTNTTIKEIAATFGLHPASIGKIVRKSGIGTHRGSRKNNLASDIITAIRTEMPQSGYGLKAICDKYKLSKDCVRNILNRKSYKI